MLLWRRLLRFKRNSFLWLDGISFLYYLFLQTFLPFFISFKLFFKSCFTKLTPIQLPLMVSTWPWKQALVASLATLSQLWLHFSGPFLYFLPLLERVSPLFFLVKLQKFHSLIRCQVPWGLFGVRRQWVVKSWIIINLLATYFVEH